MRTRLVACLAGGALGAVLAPPISQSLTFSPKIVLIGCTLLGLAAGYVISIFIDVFAVSSEDQNAES